MQLIVVMRGSSVAEQVDDMKYGKGGREAECLVTSYRKNHVPRALCSMQVKFIIT